MTPEGNVPEVRISNNQKAIEVDEHKLRDLVAYVGQAEGKRIGEVDVSIVTAEQIGAVNRRWLERSGPTDVISWDLSDEHTEGLCLQLVVCGEVAAEQGQIRQTGLEHELMLYVVHGMLHAMGYDDQAVRPAARMHAREEELLAQFRDERTGSGEPG
jgi:probable rRNA maturation factor